MKSLLRKKLRVVLISAEAYPFAGSGTSGLAIQSLPESLSRLGYDVSLVVPKYRRPAIEALPFSPVLQRFLIPIGSNKVSSSVYQAEAAVSPASPVDCPVDPDPPARRFRIYFIENAKYFDRERIFGSENAPYLDNDERFTFFSRAALEFLWRARIGADIIHCHDWPTALVPLFLRTEYGGRRHFRKTASVFTVHNPTAQGDFPPESFALTGLSWDLFTPERLAPAGRFNFTAAGFLFADSLSAGDEASAEAVRTGAAGAELPAILARRTRAAGEISKKEKKDGNGQGEDTNARFKFEAPASGPEVAEVYRQAMILRRGGSHV
ncbi:MAG: glycogen/starch synthase [Candidatus Aminicenantes bacterium]|nr:glycogen/starch synthase [Candidatus Aminicenantes bacterium]